MTGESKRDLTERKNYGCKGHKGEYKDRKGNKEIAIKNMWQ